MSRQDDRSDAALRERLGIAEKATQGPWKTDEVVTRKKDFEPSYVVKDKDGFTIVDVLPVSAYQANAAHIAASSPDVVREDIEELLRLRQENKRLCGELERRDEEISSLERDLDFTSLEQYILIEKLFNSRICHKDILCEQEDPKNWKFEGQGGCKNCWDEWARHLASDAIEEAERNAE